jgi:glutamate racemase
VGMEPAVKPAAEHTQSGVVGVLATPATFQGELFASVVERFASGVTVLQDTCPGLVMEVDSGNLDSPQVRAILERALKPMLAQGIDTVVLGCTHFPFVIPTIKSIVGPDVRVIDPAPAIARQVERLLEANGLRGPDKSSSQVRYLTTGDPKKMESLLPELIGVTAEVHKLEWDGLNLRV